MDQASNLLKLTAQVPDGNTSFSWLLQDNPPCCRSYDDLDLKVPCLFPAPDATAALHDIISCIWLRPCCISSLQPPQEGSYYSCRFVTCLSTTIAESLAIYHLCRLRRLVCHGPLAAKPAGLSSRSRLDTGPSNTRLFGRHPAIRTFLNPHGFRDVQKVYPLGHGSPFSLI